MRLHQADGIEVMILNPRLAANFAKALNARGKTDQSDARVLREYAASRPFGGKGDSGSSWAIRSSLLVRSDSSSSESEARVLGTSDLVRETAGRWGGGFFANLAW